MDLIVTPLMNAALLALFTVILAWLGKTRFDSLERRMDAHDMQNERRFEGIERRLEQTAAEIAQLRSDLLQVVLAQTPQARPQTG